MMHTGGHADNKVNQILILQWTLIPLKFTKRSVGAPFEYKTEIVQKGNVIGNAQNQFFMINTLYFRHTFYTSE